jgi:hypothetical protein
VNRGGVEPLGPRVKSPLPGHPGLEGSRSWRVARSGATFVCAAHVSSSRDVGPSSRERSAVSRLSAERSAFELRKVLVRLRGVEPRASCMSGKHSAAELAHAPAKWTPGSPRRACATVRMRLVGTEWYPFRDSNPGSRCVRPPLLAAKLKGWCAGRDSNLH